jgi:hypothetical protein
MVKAILTTKVSPTYDDLPEERYHFPRAYLRQVERAVGDFAVYYEPRRSSGDMSSRGGRQAYFAVATITAVEPDPAHADHFYARIADYLEFDWPVPFREGGDVVATARPDSGPDARRALRLCRSNAERRQKAEIASPVAVGFEPWSEPATAGVAMPTCTDVFRGRQSIKLYVRIKKYFRLHSRVAVVRCPTVVPRGILQFSR